MNWADTYEFFTECIPSELITSRKTDEILHLVLIVITLGCGYSLFVVRRLPQDFPNRY